MVLHSVDWAVVSSAAPDEAVRIWTIVVAVAADLIHWLSHLLLDLLLFFLAESESAA